MNILYFPLFIYTVAVSAVAFADEVKGPAPQNAIECEDAAACDGQPGVFVECDAGSGMIKVRPTCTAVKWTKKCQSKGVYSIWDLIVTEQDGKESSVITDTRKVTHSCKLNKQTYELDILPSPFNVNLLGHCGASPTAKVILRSEGKKLFARELVKDCDRGPEVKSLSFDVRTHSLVEVLESNTDLMDVDSEGGDD